MVREGKGKARRRKRATEKTRALQNSQGYINGSENMGASHMEDEQVGPKA
jgi:hypothetical protein